MDNSQECAAITLQLGGAAREQTRLMNFEEMTRGEVVNGQDADAASSLLSALASQFEPLGEEIRPWATRGLFEFTRNHDESTDALLGRFLTLRFRA